MNRAIRSLYIFILKPDWGDSPQAIKKALNKIEDEDWKAIHNFYKKYFVI